jgi:hypothetical protein
MTTEINTSLNKMLITIIIIKFPSLSHTGEIHNVAPREAPRRFTTWKVDALPLELPGQRHTWSIQFVLGDLQHNVVQLWPHMVLWTR